MRWKIVLLTKTGDPGRLPDLGEEHEFFLAPVEFKVPVRHSRAEGKEQWHIWVWDAKRSPELKCKFTNTSPAAAIAVNKMTPVAMNKELKAELYALSAFKILGTLP